MKIHASEQKSKIDFPITPAGTHPARCVQIIDQGTQKVTSREYGDKLQRKLFVLYELPLQLNTFTDKDGNEKSLPFGMPKTYTNSTFEMAALYQHLEAWFGEEFTLAPEAFDLKRMLGEACLLSVAHKNGNEGKYAVLAALAALPEGMQCPPRVNPLIFLDLDEFDQGVFDTLSDRMKSKIALSPEFQVLIGQAGQRPQAIQEAIQDRNQDAPLAQSENPAPNVGEFEDIPFAPIKDRMW